MQRAALGGLATMWAATRVNVEQASKRATRGPIRRITGQAGTGREASDARILPLWKETRRALRDWLAPRPDSNEPYNSLS